MFLNQGLTTCTVTMVSRILKNSSKNTLEGVGITSSKPVMHI